MQRVRDRAWPQTQVKPLAQQGRDLAVRQSEMLIQQHDERNGLRPEMRARGA
jgi:hypothetical protein